jgi:hypothetical protein
MPGAGVDGEGDCGDVSICGDDGGGVAEDLRLLDRVGERSSHQQGADTFHEGGGGVVGDGSHQPQLSRQLTRLDGVMCNVSNMVALNTGH